MPNQIDEARKILSAAKSVMVLTGAGISVESGIPTFRGNGGLWQGMKVEDWATPEGYLRDTPRVWRFYNQQRSGLAAVKPNPGHEALAAMQRKISQRGGSFVLATQNIDGLHQAAGNEGVLELHGSLKRLRCWKCDYRLDVGYSSLEQVPCCPHGHGDLRPDVVWFGEMLPQDIWQAAARAAAASEVFLTVGTSAVVYPAAQLVQYARGESATCIEVNLEPTPASDIVDISLLGKAGEILPQLLE